MSECNRTVRVRPSLTEFYEREVLPRLTAELLFTHEAHRFHRDNGKWRGGCPRHESESGTAFYLDTKTLAWRCPACQVGGGPVQYLFWLQGGKGSPRGRDFVDIVRKLAELVGVPFPERELTDEERERARRRDARRAVLAAVIEYGEEALWSDAGTAARAYLRERGLDDEHVRQLHLGLYLSHQDLRQRLRDQGHADEDVQAAGVLWPQLEGYILFPWSDEYGQPLTIYGTWQSRTPPAGKPKKLALPNPKGPDRKAWDQTKRSPLYYDRARRAGHTHLVLVEGVTDGAVAQARGDDRVVACVAAELSRLQAETLARNKVEAVTIALDPDSAGEGGIASCVKSLLAVGITPYVAPRLPDGLDPDDFIVREGLDAWRAHVDQAVHAFRYKARVILGSHRPADEWTDRAKDAARREASAFAAHYRRRWGEDLARHFWPELASGLGVDVSSIQDACALGRPPAFDGGPEPIRVDLMPVPPLAEAMIPAPFRGWLGDIARRGCFPLEYPASAAVVALSSLVGRKVGIRPKRHDDWLVVPNLWGAVVGPPGIQKSPAVQEAMRPLRRLAADAVQTHDREIKNFEVDSLVAKAKAKAAKDALEKAAKGSGASDEKLRELAAQAEAPGGKRPPSLKRYETNDPTVEKLGELLAENPNGILLFRDELTGFLRTLDKQGHEADRAFYLEAWNGTGSYVYDRIGRGTLLIPSVCVSLFGTIQPGPLARYVRAAATGDNDGLMNRFQMLLYPDPPAEWVNVDRHPDSEAKSCAYQVFQRLDALSPGDLGAEEEKEQGIPFLRFAPAAQDFFDGWRTELENRLRSGDDSALMQCHLAKYRSLMPSLALLFHLIDVAGGQATGAVTLRSAEAAAAWCQLLEAHAQRLYQMAFEGDPEPAMRLGDRIRASLPNPFRARDVVRKGWSGLDSTEEVERALLVLEDRRWVKAQQAPAGAEGGRPTTVWWVNPALRNGRSGSASA
jgi:putative DNA primase/helicase